MANAFPSFRSAGGVRDVDVARFTSTTGTGSETVRVNSLDEYYIASWHTDLSDLDPTRKYRIRVLVDGVEVGHADVEWRTAVREARGCQ